MGRTMIDDRSTIETAETLQQSRQLAELEHNIVNSINTAYANVIYYTSSDPGQYRDSSWLYRKTWKILVICLIVLFHVLFISYAT